MSLTKKQAEFLSELRKEAYEAEHHLRILGKMLSPISDSGTAALALLDDVKAAGRFLDRATNSIAAIGVFLDRLP